MAAGRLFKACCFSHSNKISSLISPEIHGVTSSLFHTDVVHRGNPVQSAQNPLSPAVRYLIDTNGIDVAQIIPTGPKNRLLKGDVLNFLSANKGRTAPTVTETSSTIPSQTADSSSSQSLKDDSPSPVAQFTDIPLTSMRKTIAKRLTESKATIPYSYSVIDCKMDSLLKLREELLKEQEKSISVNDLIVKAVGIALQRVPECNASWINEAVQIHSNIDVSVAVATEGGLITPIIERADTILLSDLSSQVKSLAKRAREGKLQPHEYQGGTFCVSNLGMFGISEFTAIINPPQAAILAVGGVKTIPYISDDSKEGVARVMSVTLSHDCRVIDNELAAKWLTVFKGLVETPSFLL